MSMLDWNGDGKKDIMDNYIEYQIYQDVMNDDNDDNDDEPISYNSKPKNRNKDLRATTTDNKRIHGSDINGRVSLLVSVVTILAWVFIIKAFGALWDNRIGLGLLLTFLGIATAVFGKWLLLGKNIIKKERQGKYYPDDNKKNN